MKTTSASKLKTHPPTSSSGSKTSNIKSKNALENISNAPYKCDLNKLDNLRKQCPWNDNPKYLTKAAVSPSAVVKMMIHCQKGVDKGIQKGGRPIEVMGLLLGRPDPETPTKLTVTDVFPLSIEGFETSVVADDVEVANEMIRTAESIERTRHERVMGWYHSHPFDVGVHSNCFFSSTDIQTQLIYQRSEDPNGNPWLGIVIDPLRSLKFKRPEMKAFRTYPPGYHPPDNECPDGSIIVEEKLRLEIWGKSWASYYELEMEYFMSSSARNIMNILTKNYVWMSVLGSSPMQEAEVQEEFPKKISKAAEKLKLMEATLPSSLLPSSSSSSMRGVLNVDSFFGGGPNTRGMESDANSKEKEHEKGYQMVVDLATEKLQAAIAQTTKQSLFSS